MPNSSSTLSVVGILFLAMPLTAQQEGDLARAKTIVNRVLAREQRVVCGRFVYHRLSVRKKVGFRKIDEGPIHFSINNDTWKTERHLSANIGDAQLIETTLVRLCRDGCLVSFREDTELFLEEKSLSVSREAEFKEAVPLHKLKDAPPYWAGTLRYKTTAQHVRDNVGRVRLGGRVKIDNNDTLVLEWEVPAREAGTAFYLMTDPLIKDGGLLRLYVAPKLGFALPLIEYVSRAGEVQTSFSCSDFHEIADGIFFPKNAICALPSLTFHYSINAVKVGNEPTGRDDIDFVLPADTMILGAREIGMLGARLDRDTRAKDLTAKMKAAKTGGKKSTDR